MRGADHCLDPRQSLTCVRRPSTMTEWCRQLLLRELPYNKLWDDTSCKFGVADLSSGQETADINIRTFVKVVWE